VRNNFIKSIIAISITLVFFALLFEIALRVVFYQSMDFDIEMWKYSTKLKQASSIPNLGHEHAPNTQAFLMGVDVKINSKRLRDREFRYERTPGTKRVLMLGDSLTFGWGVADSDTTSKVLEDILNSTGQAYEVINTGVGNYNTAQQVTYFLQEGHKYDPDMVVLNYFVNDAEPTPSVEPGFLAQYSYFYVFIRARWDVFLRHFNEQQTWHQYYQNLYKDDNLGWDQADKSIRALAAFVEGEGIPLVIANYPELRNLKDYPFTKTDNWLDNLAKELGVPYLDLKPSLEGLEEEDLWVTRPDPHPNRVANQQFAEYLSARIFKP
jgi:lysophospholipase L1-like esterase